MSFTSAMRTPFAVQPNPRVRRAPTSPVVRGQAPPCWQLSRDIVGTSGLREAGHVQGAARHHRRRGRGAQQKRGSSRLDGNACVALLEGRGTISPAGNLIALTDPPPVQLTKVAEPWSLALEPVPEPTATTEPTEETRA